MSTFFKDNTQKISILDKDCIEKMRFKAGHNFSSHAFQSIFLWQEEMGLSLYKNDKFYTVKCQNRGENTWFFPCGEKNSVYDFISSKMDEKDFSLCYMRDDDAMWLSQVFPNAWEIYREEESDEYVCDVKQYINMSGGKYKDLRKFCGRIERDYSVTAKPLSEKTEKDALEIMNQWGSNVHNLGIYNLLDRNAFRLFIKYYKELEINGTLIYLDDVPASIFAGFELDKETVDIVMGKCVPSAPNDLVYYAMREYLAENCMNYKFCNLEEDLGIAGIKLMKNKMRPAFKNEILGAKLK